MRADGLPWFFDQIVDAPEEEHGRKRGNFNIDDFGHLVAQCAWMHQGRFKFLDPTRNDIIQLPFALTNFKPGMKLINYRTKTEYNITSIIQNYRASSYQEPTIDNVPESIRIPHRVWRGFHPDELTGATVQISSSKNDLDPKQGDFLSIETSNRLAIRQAFAVARDDLSGTEKGDHAPYRIRYRVDRHEPGYGKRPFQDPKGAKPVSRHAAQLATGDPTVEASLSAQFFDALVRFELEAENAHELNVLTNWFECFMERYTPVLERIGFNRVLYWDRLEVEDPFLERAGEGAKRRLRYYVRTERLWPAIRPVLRQVDLEIKPKSAQEE